MSQSSPVSVVVVSWNTRELLRACLKSVEASPSVREVIVVDNASTDGSAEMVRAEFPLVKLIANSENVGFGRANNPALRMVQGEAVLLLNPDAVLEPNALEQMLNTLTTRPDAAIVGPQVLNDDGSIQPTRRRFPTLATAFLESTLLQRLISPKHQVYQRYYVEDRSSDDTQNVDWLVGACLLVRRAAMEQVGGLDERFFMYFEETDWCRRFIQAGWAIVYDPVARVTHLGGRSSDQAVLRRHCVFNESKCRYVRKWHGLLPALALRWFLFITSLLQLGEEALKLTLGHKRQLRRERVAMWQGVLRWQASRLISDF